MVFDGTVMVFDSVYSFCLFLERRMEARFTGFGIRWEIVGEMVDFGSMIT
jgi:hypothetical protein